MVIYCNQTYHGNHFKMYRSIKPLCCITGTNIVLKVNYTLKTNKQTNSQRKRSDLWLPWAEEWGERELDEGSQKVQIPSYKINKYQRCNL